MKKSAESSILPIVTSQQDPSSRSSTRNLIIRPNNRLYGLILVGMGILEFFAFRILYYSLELHIFACVSALIGTVLQIAGMIKLYLGVRSANGAKTLIGVMIGCTLMWSWFFFYFSMLIARHIWVL